ncbi:unnamed protein product [Dovyalis caffra]|uniref:Uncharacterized protein n=1 Tax=Dovyalis caffra TaxID=77055 RepID=A0AAV1SAH8_9ROSI|nr:unnamed protein product [Dovyalis caffra]
MDENALIKFHTNFIFGGGKSPLVIDNRETLVFHFPVFMEKIKNMVLTGLEADHLNPYDAVSGLNKLVFPEFCLQRALCVRNVWMNGQNEIRSLWLDKDKIEVYVA